MSIHLFNVTHKSFQDFKKRQALNECFKSSRKKQEVLFIKTLIYKEHVIQRDQKTETKIYMNIDVEMNMINQRFVVKQSMSLLNVNLSRFIWMNNQNVYCYNVYEMRYWFIDSWNIEKKDISIFYAINKKESFLILSMLNMQFKHIRINMIAKTWCFNVNEHAFKLFFAQAFAKALQDESIMYALVMINVVEESIIEH